MAFSGIVADPYDSHIVRLKFSDPIAKPAGFLGATTRKIFWVEVEEDDFFADEVGQFKVFPILVCASEKWGRFTNLRHVGKGERDGREQQSDNGFSFHFVWSNSEKQ